MTNKKVYKYILFDWDGTLVKTLDIWLDTYKFLCKKYNADISNLSDLEIVEKSFGLWAEGLKNLGVKEYNKVYEEAKKVVDEKVKNVQLYNHVKETLEELTVKDKVLALHTSSFRNMLYPAIVNKDLEKYFKVILTKDDIKNGKPDPEVIEKELNILNAKPKEAIVIGDSDHDIKTGKNAGVDTILFYPEENKKFYRDDFVLKEKPDFIIKDLLEVINIVQTE